MAHDIARDANGAAQFITRTAAWHHLGQVTGKYMQWSEIARAGTLDYKVIKAQLYGATNFDVTQGPTLQPVDAWATFRVNPGSDERIFLGTVGEDYEVLDHVSGFSFMDSLMGARDGAHYETAGALGKGERVFGTAALNQSIKIGGDDKINVYLLFSTSHNGTMSYSFRLVTERVVCSNTLAMALGERSRGLFKVKHTKNAQTGIDNAQAALAALDNDVMRMEDRLNFLANRKMTREGIDAIMDRLFPKREVIEDTAAGRETTTKDSTRRTNIIADVLKLYEIADGRVFPDQVGSAYNLLNAVTEYTDFERSVRSGENNRAMSATFGTGDKLKATAFEVIYETAQKHLPLMSARPVYVTGPGSATPLLDLIVA